MKKVLTFGYDYQYKQDLEKESNVYINQFEKTLLSIT